MKKEKLLEGIKNYNQDEVIKNLFLVMFFNFLLAKSKGVNYNDSWQKRGIFTLSQNLERKIDRLFNQLFPPGKGFFNIENLGLGKTESILDTISDLSNYANLGLVFFQKKLQENNESELFDIFLKDQIKFIISNLDDVSVKKQIDDIIIILKDFSDSLFETKDLEKELKIFFNIEKRIK